MRTAVRLPLIAVLMLALLIGLFSWSRTAQAQPQPRAVVVPAAAATPTLVVTDTSLVTARHRAVTAQRLVAVARAARAAQVQALRSRIVEVARKQLGDRYSAGAAGPNAFDCSGLTRYVYKVATGKELPHQSYAQYAKVKRIPRSKAQPGDLVFFFRNGAHHVGIYIGKGRMIDAPRYGEPVRVSPISGSWWGRTYSGMGRLLPA